MPKSKLRKNHKKRTQHWRLMMTHNRHRIAKEFQAELEAQRDKTIAEMLNSEEQKEQVVEHEPA